MRKIWLLVLVLAFIAVVPVAAQDESQQIPVLSVDQPQEAEFADRVTSQLFLFAATEGDVATVTMRQDEGSVLDPYLVLIGPGGDVIATDDDSGGSFAAQLSDVELPETGVYLVLASSFEFIDPFVVPDTLDEPLPYTILLEGSFAPVRVEPDEIEIDSTEAQLNGQVSDTVDEETPVAIYQFEVTSVASLSAEIAAVDFQTVLHLFDPFGSRIAIDYTTLESVLLEDPGIYTLLATDVAFYTLGSEQAGVAAMVEFAGGDYTLTLSGQ